MLQDAHGLNVPILLWCLWSGAHFAEPDAATIKKALAIGDAWEKKVVAPLRSARRALKEGVGGVTSEALLEQVKAAELSAERIALDQLESLSRGSAGAPSVADAAAARVRRTLAAYVRAAGAAETPGFSVGLLEEIIELTFRAQNQGVSQNHRDR